MQAQVDNITTVVSHMKLQREEGQTYQDQAQLFWSISRFPQSEASSTRFDPCNRLGVNLEVDSIRFK